ncbi:cell division protein ZapA [bacterium]|jgi:cell division protein ZapA|nr:cell division protein ZapA [bacterium]
MPDFSAESEREDAIRVTILGKEYRLLPTGDPDYMRHVAELVDRKMTEVQRRDRSQPPSNVAVLAALQLAHELLELQKQQDHILQSVEGKAKQLEIALEQKLHELGV